MANTKNFGLDGVASSLQLGKGGQHIVSADGRISAKSADGTTLVNVQAADPVAPSDVVTKQVLDAVDGATIKLGNPTDASLADGAVSLTSTTTVVNAVDQLNEILGKLVPTAPAAFPGSQSLTVSGTGQNPLLASGAVPDNTNGGTIPVTAGQSVTRVITATVSSNVIGDNGTTGFVGPGDSGTVQALVNGAVADSQVMATGSQNKSGVLTITNDQAYPLATPGFWESFRAQIVGAPLTQGWNRLKLNHTAGGATNDVYVVRDTMVSSPVNSNVVITETTAGTYSYSSGIPHYGTGGVLNVSLTTANLSGETYTGNAIYTVSSISGNGTAFTPQSFFAGQGGLPSVLPRQMAPFSTNLPVNVNGANNHCWANVLPAANNANSAGGIADSTVILLKNGTAGSTKVDELSIPVTIAQNGGPSGNGFRVNMTNGDNPADDKSGLTATDWINTAAINAWDASVVGGILKNDVTNYTTGYLPAGPNYSSHNATQYVTFALRRTAVSKFDISITGTYAGLWVKLPGVTESYTTASNGWYSMSTLYGGAGFPGNTGGANGSLGCALGAVASGSTGSFTCTFGTLSSTAAANNLILVRVKLTAGQSITAMSFIPATR